MEGAAKSRVCAYRNEVDSWRKSRLNGNQATIETAATAGATASEPPGVKPEGTGGTTGYSLRSKSKKKLLLWSVPLAAIIVAAAALLWIRLSPGQPADFKIHGSKLIVLDQKGKRLWQFDTGIQTLLSEKEYRGFFNTRRTGETSNPVLPFLVIKDINRDNKNEVLFAPKTNDNRNETGLFCLNSKGDAIWHFRTGAERQFGDHLYSSEYPIRGIEPYDLDNDDRFEIIMTTGHLVHSPSELMVLDCQGKMIGEFVNWGRIKDIAYSDLDLDGKVELLIAGHYDEFRSGFLAVFDSSDVRGVSPQSWENTCRECGAGSERYYLVFPRTDVDKILAPQKESICRIDIAREGQVRVSTDVSNIFFTFDPQLRLLDVLGSDLFWLRHRELNAAGKITSELNDAYYENLKKGVLYWDGTQWTSTPTMNQEWNGPR